MSHVKGEEELRLHYIEHNRYRKKTSRDIYNEYMVIESILKPTAEKHQKAGRPLANIGERVDVRESAAKTLGVSHGQLSKIKAIYSNEDLIPEEVKAFDEGKKTVNQVYNLLKRAKRKKKVVEEVSERSEVAKLEQNMWCGDFLELAPEVLHSKNEDLGFSDDELGSLRC